MLIFDILVHCLIFSHGLVETFNSIMPNANHRFYVRYLYANFKKLFKVINSKDTLYAAIRVYTKVEFHMKMKALVDLDPKAA